MQGIFKIANSIKDSSVIKMEVPEDNRDITFRILEKDDPLGFVLGDITNCCQHIGGIGEACVLDGYTNTNSGFMVFEQKLRDDKGNFNGQTRILGQAYIWYDPETKTVCLDNIEIPTKIIDELRRGVKNNDSVSSKALLDAIENAAECIMKTMTKNGVEVLRVTTGEGFNDLKQELSQRYEKEVYPESMHRNYGGYSDARYAQYVIRTYDQITNAYEDIITKSIQVAALDLSEIKSDVNNQNIL